MVNGAPQCLLSPDIDLETGTASLIGGLSPSAHPLYALPCLGSSVTLTRFLKLFREHDDDLLQ